MLCFFVWAWANRAVSVSVGFDCSIYFTFLFLLFFFFKSFMFKMFARQIAPWVISFELIWCWQPLRSRKCANRASCNLITMMVATAATVAATEINRGCARCCSYKWVILSTAYVIAAYYILFLSLSLSLSIFMIQDKTKRTDYQGNYSVWWK